MFEMMFEVAKTVLMYGLGTILGFIPIIAIVFGGLAVADALHDKWQDYIWEREENDR